MLCLALISGAACSSPDAAGHDAGFDVPLLDVLWVDSRGLDGGTPVDAGRPDDAAADVAYDAVALGGDASVPGDASIFSDGSVFSDGGVFNDGGSEAGVPPDGSVSEAGVDGSVPPDGGLSDTGPSDTGVSDGGDAATDSSVDAGPRCPPGSFDDDDNAATPCRPWSECEAGEYVQVAGSDVSDQECAGCESGTFSVTDDAESCANWTHCRRGSYVETEGTTTSDRSCESCPEGRYSSGRNQAQCIELELCAAGRVQTRAGSATRPVLCADCIIGEYCAGAEAPRLTCPAPTWDHDADPATACATWTECVPGTYILEAGDARSDRLCEGCADGTFSDESNALECRPWRDCPIGEAPTPGTASQDRNCIPLMEM